MENSKTIVCPNCGASSTNLDKCEYCGSMLVKIASVLVSTSKDTTSEIKKLGFGSTVYVSPVILQAVEKTISLGERLNITTVLPIHREYIEFSYSPTTPIILKLCFNMDDKGANYHFMKLEGNRIAKIFEIYQNDRWMYASVVLDSNTHTITQLIQVVLKNVFNRSDAELEIGPISTCLNKYKYLFSDENKQPIEFVYDYGFRKYLSWRYPQDCPIIHDKDTYEFYIYKITMQESNWYHYLRDNNEGIYDKGLYDIIFADSILRCEVDKSYEDKVDINTRLALNKRVIWGSEDSKQKYIARCKEIGSRYYFNLNVFPKLCNENTIYGIISENYDPQVYGPIVEYIKNQEDKIHQEATSDAERIANIIQRRHEVFSIVHVDFESILVKVVIIGFIIFVLWFVCCS